MIVPVRCFSCGKQIGSLYEEFRNRMEIYENFVEEMDRGRTEEDVRASFLELGYDHIPTPKEIMDDLGLERYCCRRILLSTVDLIDDIKYYG